VTGRYYGGSRKHVNRLCSLTLINPTETRKHFGERQGRPHISLFQSEIKIKRDYIYLSPHHEDGDIFSQTEINILEFLIQYPFLSSKHTLINLANLLLSKYFTNYTHILFLSALIIGNKLAVLNGCCCFYKCL